MAKLKFGVWIPSYLWPDGSTSDMERLTESIGKCEEYGLDVWVIDHLLSPRDSTERAGMNLSTRSPTLPR